MARLLGRLQEFLAGERFGFAYEPTATHGAEETFRLRRGNCVSYTSLFVALGRAVGIPLRGALLARGEAERENDLVVVNNHMVAALREPGGVAVYDFAREGNRPRAARRALDRALARDPENAAAKRLARKALGSPYQDPVQWE